MTVVVLNGERRELPDDEATVETAVHLAGAPTGGRGVAVALDGEVVPRGEWATTEVREGQELEVLHAVQGGA
jgi:sulfur carrier protein